MRSARSCRAGPVRTRCAPAAPSAPCPPPSAFSVRSNRVMRLTQSTRAYIAANLRQQHLLIARIDVETGAHPPAYEAVDDGGQRRPGQTEPEGSEYHYEQREGRIVGHEDVAVEPGADGDAGRGQGDVHGAEEQHPAPRDGPVGQEPEVDQAVERHQRDHQEHVPPVVGIPEVRPVGYLEGRDQCDEPAAPDRDPRRIGHDVRVGAHGRRKPLRYGSDVSPGHVGSPGLQ